MTLWNWLKAKLALLAPSQKLSDRLAEMGHRNAEVDRRDRKELDRIAQEIREAHERLGGKPPPVVPSFSDEQVTAALTAAGVQTGLHPEFVTFQRKHGGRTDAFGLNAMRWGILHCNPEWLEAGRVEAEPDEDRPGVWHILCADVHPSDTMTIDQAGRLYWCRRVRYRHYDDYFAGQSPLDWSLSDT